MSEIAKKYDVMYWFEWYFTKIIYHTVNHHPVGNFIYGVLHTYFKNVYLCEGWDPFNVKLMKMPETEELEDVLCVS